MELIKYDQLKAIHNEIVEKTSLIKTLVVNEETVKQIKKERAAINKLVNEYDNQRKELKDIYMKQWNKFDTNYKELITTIHKAFDLDVKTKINEVEETLKENKKLILMEYFTEYAQSLNIDFVTIEDLIDVKLSTSIKKYKEEIKTKLDKIDFDKTLIYTQGNEEMIKEIMYEYKISFNVNDAILKVKERKEAIKVVEQVNTKLDSPIVEEEMKMSFTVYGTLRQLKDIKNYIEKVGVRYE